MVAGWALLNAAFVVVLVGYGGSAIALGCYAGACAIVAIVASVVHVSRRRAGTDRRFRVPTGGEVPVVAAAACAFAGLAVVFGYWFLPVAVLPLAAIAVTLVKHA
jgi:hypothetical protein